MTNTITTGQQIFLDGLRKGDKDASEIVVNEALSDATPGKYVVLKKFLKRKGHPEPQPADLYLTVSREAFVRILHYADNRQCLLLQCCFGFDVAPVIEIVELGPIPPNRPIHRVKDVGRVILINKGNFQELDGRSDDEFFNKDTVFLNQDGNHELFRDMDLNQPLSEDEANHYIKNFRAMYHPDRTPVHNPYTYGYPLPVKAILQIINDQSTALGSADTFTFRWGLTNGDSNTANLGNFTLAIGTGDLFIDPAIEFRSDTIHVLPAGNTPCPPNPGCPR